jgi:hypothetical protein
VGEGLRVVGAGLPRTGTHSLRVALERVLGGTCYHMSTMWERDGRDVGAFLAARRGDEPDWRQIFEGCTAAVDWPVSAFWSRLSERYPEAVVVLSERDSPQTWWRSVDATVFGVIRHRIADRATADELDGSFADLLQGLTHDVFCPDWDDRENAMAAYTRWNERVRAEAPPDRLVVYRPGDGWEPLCAALGVPVPDEPYPHTNSTDEFIARQVERVEERDDPSALPLPRAPADPEVATTGSDGSSPDG